MTDEQHRHKAERDKQGGIREEDFIGDRAHQGSGDDRGHDLRRHGRRIVITGEFADIGTFAHFNDHRERVDVNGRPRDTDQREEDVHDQIDGGKDTGQDEAGNEAGRKKNDAEHDGLFPPDFGSHDTDRDVGNDRACGADQETGRRSAEPLPHDDADISRKPGGDGVVADKPQYNGCKNESKGTFDFGRKHLVSGTVILGKIPFGMLRFQRAGLFDQFRLLYGQEQNADSYEHQAGDRDEQRLIVDMIQSRRFRVRIHDSGNAEVDDTADRAHQVDDRVRFGTERLGRDIRHQSDCRGAIGSHCDQQQPQNHDKGDHLEGGCRRCVTVVQNRKKIQENDRAARTEQDVRHALSDLRIRFIGQTSEEREQEQRQNVVRCHDHTGDGLVHVERIG